jgi:hypothetical protein
MVGSAVPALGAGIVAVGVGLEAADANVFEDTVPSPDAVAALVDSATEVVGIGANGCTVLGSGPGATADGDGPPIRRRAAAAAASRGVIGLLTGTGVAESSVWVEGACVSVFSESPSEGCMVVLLERGDGRAGAVAVGLSVTDGVAD